MTVRVPICFLAWLLALVSTPAHTTHVLPRPARLSWAVQKHYLPDSILTPGAIYSDVTAADLKPGYAGTARNVPDSVKDQVFREYGYDPRKIDKRQFEIDHLVSLELGGSNDIRNLWASPYAGKWNAHMKDALENRYAAKVRRQEMTLGAAQKSIAGDWRTGYVKEFGEPK